MLYWYAYPLDVTVFGPGAILTAPNCFGGGPGRSCLFDQFLCYIDVDTNFNPLWTGSTTVGTNLDPDVVDTAIALSTGGAQYSTDRYTNTLDPNKLFPG